MTNQALQVAVEASLREVLREERLPDEALSMKAGAAGCSVLLRNQMLCRLRGAREDAYLLLPLRFRAAVKELSPEEGKEGFHLAWNAETEAALKLACRSLLDSFAKRFDCCDRYEDCSACGHCVHPDLEYAMDCGYKQILRSGRIFYGSSRNI